MPKRKMYWNLKYIHMSFHKKYNFPKFSAFLKT